MKHVTSENIKEGLKVVIYDFYGKYRVLEFLCYEPGSKKKYAYFIDLHKQVERLHLETLVRNHNAFLYDGNYDSIYRKQISIWESRIADTQKDLKKEFNK